MKSMINTVKTSVFSHLEGEFRWKKYSGVWLLGFFFFFFFILVIVIRAKEYMRFLVIQSLSRKCLGKANDTKLFYQSMNKKETKFCSNAKLEKEIKLVWVNHRRQIISSSSICSWDTAVVQFNTLSIIFLSVGRWVRDGKTVLNGLINWNAICEDIVSSFSLESPGSLWETLFFSIPSATLPESKEVIHYLHLSLELWVIQTIDYEIWRTF